MTFHTYPSIIGQKSPFFQPKMVDCLVHQHAKPARNLLAYFPSACPELPCHTSSMPAEFLNKLTKNLASHLPHKLRVLLYRKIIFILSFSTNYQQKKSLIIHRIYCYIFFLVVLYYICSRRLLIAVFFYEVNSKIYKLIFVF